MLISVSEAADWLTNAVKQRKLGASKAMEWHWPRTLQHMDSGSGKSKSKLAVRVDA